MIIMLKITNTPSSPGVYIMRNKGGEIIYVGKAKNIRKRVAAYSPEKQHDPKTSELVAEAEAIEFILTDNEVEALILEARLIKEHKPKYNIDLKDGTSYPYIRVTLEEDFPRIFITRDNPRKQSFRDAEKSERFFVQKEKGSLYLGPFTDVKSARLAVRIAINIFGLHKGEKSISKKFKVLENREEYGKRVEKAILFLRGNTKDILKELKEKMKQASQEQNFEAAKIYRDEINSIETLSIKQKVEAERGYDEDYIGFIRAGEAYFVQVFNVRRGLLLGRTRHDVKSADAPKKFLADFLEQFYYDAPVPERIVVMEEPEDAELMEEYLKKISGKNVLLSIPKSEAEKEMVALILKNISSDVGSKYEPALVGLQRVLGLESVPLVMECFDVSNIMGSWLVGSMVRFRNGKPDKNNYRRFRIRTVEGQNDVASIREIVLRRYSRLAREHSQMPDLVVIDGGIAQLNSALSAMREAGVAIPAVALAKRLEEIYVPGKRAPLLLDRKSAALKILQRVRDEAHRFAISYHKMLRRKEYGK